MKYKKLITIILSIILGLIYLISGIAKAADINGFADIIVRYGNANLFLLAPIITFIEIVLAFAFLLLWNTHKVSLFSCFFIVFLTLILCLGYIFLGTDDCGCLGDFYQFPIWLSILRNLIMILASYWLYKNALEIKMNRFNITRPIIAFSLGLITFIISSFEIKETYFLLSYFSGSKVEHTFLEEFQKNDEETRLIFIFSPHCNNCKVETPKINQLLKQKFYKQIIGLYPKEVREKYVMDYLINYKPAFEIRPISSDSIRKITHRFPLFVTIKNGKIQKIMKEI